VVFDVRQTETHRPRQRNAQYDIEDRIIVVNWRSSTLPLGRYPRELNQYPSETPWPVWRRLGWGGETSSRFATSFFLIRACSREGEGKDPAY